MDDPRPWLKSYPPWAPKEFDPRLETLTATLLHAAEGWPDRPATLYFMGQEHPPGLTYAELAELATRCARAYVSLGVKPGERIALVLPNCPQFAVAYYGALLAGAVAVPLNVLYTPTELRELLRDSGARTVVVLDTLYAGLLKALPDRQVQRVMVASDNELRGTLDRLKERFTRANEGPQVPKKRLEDFHFWELVQESPARPPARSPKLEDTATLLYTGGTTGPPKGAMLTHRSLAANVAQLEAWLPDLRPGEEVFVTALPLFHVYGLTTSLLLPVALGAAMLLFPRARPTELLTAGPEHRPTICFHVPAMYAGLAADPLLAQGHFSSVRLAISGASPCPVELMKAYEKASGGLLVEGYGLTEASPVTHLNPLTKELRRAGAIGLPLPGTLARILDEQGQVAPPGETGELQVKGPQVMVGYWRQEAETRMVLDPEGWLSTGDVARMDEAGYFHIMDRLKDQINVSGFKVWPQEVENCLAGHPAVKEAAVIGVPDARSGEAVKAYVTVNPGASVGEAELLGLCREHLAKFKVPSSIERWDKPLPRNALGKLLRRELRD